MLRLVVVAGVPLLLVGVPTLPFRYTIVLMLFQVPVLMLGPLVLTLLLVQGEKCGREAVLVGISVDLMLLGVLLMLLLLVLMVLLSLVLFLLLLLFVTPLEVQVLQLLVAMLVLRV